MARTDPQFKLRLPPELKQKIEQAAHENNRSMNAEMISRLESTLQEEKAAVQPVVAAPVSVEVDTESVISALRESMEKIVREQGEARRDDTLGVLRELRQFSLYISTILNHMDPVTLERIRIATTPPE
ncbi:MAG: Arc family DNA-binding protein [Magnetococcales bacterium]|nr:Arc family DNA-binding protein [Magnetococcales bacterium]